jgi:hypothetical protein
MGTPLAILNNSRFPATDDALVTALIDFVNGRDIALLRSPVLKQPLRGDELAAFFAERSGKMDFDELRSQMQLWLMRVIAPDPTALNTAFQLVRRLLLQFTAHPVMRIDPKTFSVEIRYHRDFEDERAAMLFAVALLFDKSKPFSAAISRCHYEDCGNKFYLARRNPKGGPANRIYCSEEHRELGHEAGRAKRARELRARMKK